jgi:hypothetical protein
MNKQVKDSILARVQTQGITPNNYYDLLGSLNNIVAPNVDIMTITGFMSWEQRVEHINRYLNELKGVA